MLFMPFTRSRPRWRTAPLDDNWMHMERIPLKTVAIKQCMDVCSMQGSFYSSLDIWAQRCTIYVHTFQLCISDWRALFVSTISSTNCYLLMLMLSYGGGPEGENVQRALWGVNMFGAIMLDHLIMTRPLGSWACPPPTLTTYADNTILPQCNSSLQISIKGGLNGYKDGVNGVHMDQGDAWWTYPLSTMSSATLDQSNLNFGAQKTIKCILVL